MSDTTIIFVPGAWHNASCWFMVGDRLANLGFNIQHVILPSVGSNAPTPSLDLAPDVTKIKTAIEDATSVGQKVIVVAHSYSGIPAGEAVRNLDIETRQAYGDKVGVIHMVFVAAFMIGEEKSLLDVMGINMLHAFESPDPLFITHPNPVDTFYNDMPEHLV